MAKLSGKTIAILAADGYEEVELTSPRKALEEAGASVEIVSLEAGEIQGFNHMEKAGKSKVDSDLSSADINRYQGVYIPGGLFNPDHLRRDERAIAFVRGAFAKGLPVAAMCHGPQVLITADVVKGRRMTAFEAVQIDLKNAGADVKNEPVVVDKGLVTSRKPDDLDAFNKKLVEEFCEGRHDAQLKSVGAA